MASTKSDRPKVKYSPTELKLLGLLPKGGGLVTSLELVESLYNGKAPFNARQSIVGFMTSLIRKSDLNKEPYKITKTAPSGPHPTEYRKVKR